MALLTEIRGGLPTLLRRQVSRKPLAAANLNMALVPPIRGPRLLDSAADRDAYVVCLLTQLHAALRRRDVFADPSLRADPRAPAAGQRRMDERAGAGRQRQWPSP